MVSITEDTHLTAPPTRPFGPTRSAAIATSTVPRDAERMTVQAATRPLYLRLTDRLRIPSRARGAAPSGTGVLLVGPWAGTRSRPTAAGVTASKVLAGLKDKGFRIALDDFGTGYSNLSYISRLPVTAIKIDRSFVTGLMADNAALSLINGIVALAKSLHLTVICEGIETAEQRTLLEITQCDSIQGYLISRPLAAEDFYLGFLKGQ